MQSYLNQTEPPLQNQEAEFAKQSLASHAKDFISPKFLAKGAAALYYQPIKHFKWAKGNYTVLRRDVETFRKRLEFASSSAQSKRNSYPKPWRSDQGL
jgi:hypothetical protein